MHHNSLITLNMKPQIALILVVLVGSSFAVSLDDVLEMESAFGSRYPLCQNEDCTLIEQFLTVTNILLKISKTTVEASFESVVDKSTTVTSVTVIRRGKWCDYGIIQDQGCNGYSDSQVVYEEDQLKKVVQYKQCIVGALCFNRGECYGDRVQECKNKEFCRWIQESDASFHTMNALPWESLLHKTCEQAFKCEITTERKDVSLVRVDGVLKRRIKIEGEDIFLEVGKPQVHRKGQRQYYIEEIQEMKGKLKLECLQEDDNLVCMSSESKGPVSLGEVFMFNSKGEHLGDKVYMTMDVTQNFTSSDYQLALNNLQKEGGATVKDLTKVALQLAYEDLQAKFNVLALANSVSKIKEFITNLVKHLTIGVCL